MFTIKQDENLIKLSEVLKISKPLLMTIIVNKLRSSTEIGDQEDFGKSISDIVYGTLNLDVLTAYVTRNSKHKEIFGELIIIGLYDCPDCGSELEIDKDGAFNHEWIVEKCNHCDYSASGEPDWDEM